MKPSMKSPPCLHLYPWVLAEAPLNGWRGGSCVPSIEEIIEKSKYHWSQVGDFDSDNEVAEVSNVEVFKTLQQHPTWGSFFMTFGKDGESSSGEFVMGKKFAEGAQAEIYEVQIKWHGYRMSDIVKYPREYVLKVFKKGTYLLHLQAQWPQGMLQFHVDKTNQFKIGFQQLLRMHPDVYCATLLEDGRFAFVMVKEETDLRSLIDHRMLTRSKAKGPFSKKESELAMYEVAFGVNQLHSRGVVHRDIKASNVLVSRKKTCYIADFECSVGIVGTGFFRAPEILDACKHGNVNKKAELFTKAVDAYSYGMTCYEILTCKLPFEGHLLNEYDLVFEGHRPKLPKYVDDWVCKLLNRCWHPNPTTRPSLREILRILSRNSIAYRQQESYILSEREIEPGIRNALESGLKMVKSQRSLRVRLQIRKKYWFCGLFG